MLAACAELSALVWPIRHAYALGFAVTAVLAALLCAFETRGLAVVGRRAVPVFCPFCSSGCCFFRRRSLLSAGRAAGRRSPRGAGRHALRRAERRHDGGRAAHAADPVRAAAAGVRRARRPALRRHADAGYARLSAPDAERAHAAAPLRLAQPRPRRGRLSARRAVPVCGGAVHPVRHALRNDESSAALSGALCAADDFRAVVRGARAHEVRAHCAKRLSDSGRAVRGAAGAARSALPSGGEHVRR